MILYLYPCRGPENADPDSEHPQLARPSVVDFREKCFGEVKKARKGGGWVKIWVGVGVGG